MLVNVCNGVNIIFDSNNKCVLFAIRMPLIFFSIDTIFGCILNIFGCGVGFIDDLRSPVFGT